MQASEAQHGRAEEPQLRIRQLERALAALTKERDDLAIDVEQLCMQRGSHMFSSSYVASERLKFLEGQLKEHRQQLRAMTGERDSLQEDIIAARAAKKQSDEGWQREAQRAGVLERELSFFKASSAKAIAERDQAAFDAKINAADLEAAGASLAEARAQLGAQEQAAADLRGRLGSTQQRLEAAQQELGACRVQLRQQKLAHEQQQQLQQREAEQLQAAKVQLSADLATARATAGVLEEELQEARAAAGAAAQQAKQAKLANEALHAQLNAATSQVQDLQTMLEQTSAALVASQARLKETHTATTRGGGGGSPAPAGHDEVSRLRGQLAEVEALLEQAARDKLEVQLELSQAQAGEDEHTHQLQQLQQQYAAVKEQLAQATREKVEALLQVASKPQLAAAGGGGSTVQQEQQQQPREEEERREQGSTPRSPTASSSRSSPNGRTMAGPGPAQAPAVGAEARGGQADVHAQHNGGAGSGEHKEQQLCSQAMAYLQQALVVAHCYRAALQQLKPGDVAAAASAGGGGQGGGGRAKAGRRGAAGAAAAADAAGGAAPASPDPLIRLAAMAQELEADQQELLAQHGFSQQQLEEVVAALLQQQHPGALPAVALPPGAKGSSLLPAHQGAMHHASQVLGKLLKHGSGGSSSSTRAAGQHQGSARPSTPAADAPAGDGVPGAGGSSPAALLALHAALQQEIRQLAECGVSALRYIPKLTALSSLVQGGW